MPAHRAPVGELQIRHERVGIVDGGGELSLESGEERVLVRPVDAYQEKNKSFQLTQNRSFRPKLTFYYVLYDLNKNSI